jgi:hypothetical protein
MRDRLAHFMALASAVCLALLIAGCAGAATAVRAGLMPPIDWQIKTGAHHVLLVHNGPTVICELRALRDGCARRRVRHEFYIHYITPTGDRQLIWLRTPAP